MRRLEPFRGRLAPVLVGALLTVLACVPGQALSSAHAQAARAGAASLPTFGSLLVDDMHRRVFMSSGPAGSDVVVTGFDGRVVKRIGGLYGATGMALSANSRSVFVALQDGDAIAVVDAGTLRVRRLLRTPAMSCPAWVALAGGRLWMGGGCASGDGIVASANPAASTVRWARVPDTVHRSYYAPYLASPGPRSSVLAIGQLGLSPGEVTLYTVTGTKITRRTTTREGSNLGQVAFAGATPHMAIAWGWPYYVARLSTPSMSRAGNFTVGAYPVAVSFTAKGRYLVAGVSYQDRPIVIFSVGSTTPLHRVGSGNLPQRGLAVSRDGTKIFYVSTPEIRGPFTLRVLPGPTA